MRPLACINLVILAILCVLTLFTIPAAPRNLILLGGYLVMIAMLLVYPHVKWEWGRKWFPRVYPVIYIGIIFDSLVYLVEHINPWLGGDELLRRLDIMLFGVDLPLYLERFITPVAVELLTWAYMLYFIMPFLLIILMWKEGKTKQIAQWACIISINLYANYLLYLVLPAKGPRLHMPELFTVPLEGVFAANWMMNLLNQIESNKFDIFPSAHVSATMIMLYGAIKFQRKLAATYAIIFAAIVVSTVYLRYHYVVDLIAGVALAFAAIYAGNAFYRAWEGSETPAGD